MKDILIEPRIMVDELRPWPGKAKSGARHFGSGKESCHLMIEPDEHGQLDLERLHAFAESIGLRRAWFQMHASAPHYDLVSSKRDLALRAGAVFVSGMDQARARLAAREALPRVSRVSAVKGAG